MSIFALLLCLTARKLYLCSRLWPREAQPELASNTLLPWMQTFLETQQYPAEKAAEVLQILAGVGFKEELGTAPTGSAISPVLAVVQDADR